MTKTNNAANTNNTFRCYHCNATFVASQLIEGGNAPSHIAFGDPWNPCKDSFKKPIEEVGQ
jgi:hypothetical protein